MTTKKRVGTVLPAKEAVQQFVLRARRIAAHSLAQPPEQLTKLAHEVLSGTIDFTGMLTTVQTLPDEETLESLIARVRPLTVQSEPIHHAKVLEAIVTLIGTKNPELTATIDSLRAQWEQTELQGVQVQTYAMQTMDPDGNATEPISDTQLAAGLLYADLVHAEPVGPKAKSLNFTFDDRYAAAVRVFTRIAELALMTLGLIAELVDAKKITVASSAFSAPVAISTTRVERRARLYTGVPGTPLPDLRLDGSKQPDGFTQFTITELLRQDQQNHVTLTTVGADGSKLYSFDGGVTRRAQEGESARLEMLIDNCAIFKLSFSLENGKPTTCNLTETTYLDYSNAAQLAANRLILAMHDAQTVKLSFSGGAVSFALVPLEDADRDSLTIACEIFDDIVAIERHTGREMLLNNAAVSLRQRIGLRVARRLWDGDLVETRVRESVIEGDYTDEIVTRVQSAASTFLFSGFQVPLPAVHLIHPELTLTPIAQEGDKAVTRFRVVTPEDAYFYAMRADVAIERTGEHVKPTPWDMYGVDQATLGREVADASRNGQVAPAREDA